MKQIVEALSENSIVAMATGSLKYILVPNDGHCRFASGGAFWNAYTDKREAIRRCLADERCKLYAFDSLTELAAWLAK